MDRDEQELALREELANILKEPSSEARDDKELEIRERISALDIAPKEEQAPEVKHPTGIVDTALAALDYGRGLVGTGVLGVQGKLQPGEAKSAFAGMPPSSQDVLARTFNTDPEDIPWYASLMADMAMDPATYTGVGALSKLAKLAKLGDKGLKTVGKIEKGLDTALNLPAVGIQKGAEKLAGRANPRVKGVPFGNLLGVAPATRVLADTYLDPMDTMRKLGAKIYETTAPNIISRVDQKYVPRKINEYRSSLPTTEDFIDQGLLGRAKTVLATAGENKIKSGDKLNKAYSNIDAEGLVKISPIEIVDSMRQSISKIPNTPAFADIRNKTMGTLLNDSLKPVWKEARSQGRNYLNASDVRQIRENYRAALDLNIGNLSDASGRAVLKYSPWKDLGNIVPNKLATVDPAKASGLRELNKRHSKDIAIYDEFEDYLSAVPEGASGAGAKAATKGNITAAMSGGRSTTLNQPNTPSAAVVDLAINPMLRSIGAGTNVLARNPSVRSIANPLTKRATQSSIGEMSEDRQAVQRKSADDFWNAWAEANPEAVAEMRRKRQEDEAKKGLIDKYYEWGDEKVNRWTK